MLSVYRRHRENCPHAENPTSKQCRCALWATGTLEGKPYRRSLKTRNFERAEQLKRDIENRTQPEAPKTITVKDALDAFIKDCEARNLNRSTLSKYRLLATRLQDFASRKGIGSLHQLTHERAVAFRATWTGSPRTLSKSLERLRSACQYFQDNGWIASNPAKRIKAPQIKLNPRLPFSEQEIQNIQARASDDRELAFILTLRHTGLRIGDTSLLRATSLVENRLFLYTTKAGTPVSILLPDHLVSLLKKLPPNGGYFFVRGQSTAMQTCADLWRRRIKLLCKAAGVMPDHPHRFRHSLAADLLSKGASVEDVAAILGNSPAVVMKHYSQWIASRQDRLDSFLEKTWAKKLVRVK